MHLHASGCKYLWSCKLKELPLVNTLVHFLGEIRMRRSIPLSYLSIKYQLAGISTKIENGKNS